MRIKRDQITGAALILLGIVIALQVNQFRIPMKPEYPGPRLFPLIAVFGFIVCGLGIFIQGTLSKKEEPVFLVKEGWVKVGITFLILVAYVFVMKYLGYLVTTPFVLFAFSTLFAWGGKVKSKLVYRVIFSVAVTVVLYLMYVNVFGMTLPVGQLFD